MLKLGMIGGLTALLAVAPVRCGGGGGGGGGGGTTTSSGGSTGTSSGGSVSSIVFVSNYDPVPPDRVSIAHSFSGGWTTVPMVKDSALQYSFALPTTPGDYEFNIFVEAALHTEWVADSRGIRASSVAAGSLALGDGDLVTDHSGAFTLTIKTDGSVSKGPGTRLSVDTRLPPEVEQGVAQVEFLLPDPPTKYRYAAPWIQIIHDIRQPGPSTVEVDHIALHAVSGGVDTVILSTSEGYGGERHVRYPWFLSDLGAGGTLPLPMLLTSSGTWIQNPSDDPSRIWHSWAETAGHSDVLLPASVDQLYAEVKVKITGPAWVQAGIDFTKNPQDNPGDDTQEAGVSDWITEGPDWQTLTVNK